MTSQLTLEHARSQSYALHLAAEQARRHAAARREARRMHRMRHVIWFLRREREITAGLRAPAPATAASD